MRGRCPGREVRAMAKVGENDGSGGLLQQQQAAASAIWAAALIGVQRERRRQWRRPLLLHPALLLLCPLALLTSALADGEASGVSRNHSAAATAFVGAEEGKETAQQEELTVDIMQRRSASSETREEAKEEGAGRPPLLHKMLQGGKGPAWKLREEDAMRMDREEEASSREQRGGVHEPQGEAAAEAASSEGDLDSDLPPHVWEDVDEEDRAFFEQSWGSKWSEGGSDLWGRGFRAVGEEGAGVERNVSVKAILLRLMLGATSLPACDDEDKVARSSSANPQICRIALEYAENGAEGVEEEGEEEEEREEEKGGAEEEDEGQEGGALANETQAVEPLHRRSLSAPIQAAQVPMVFNSTAWHLERVIPMYSRKDYCRKSMQMALWAVGRARARLQQKDRNGAIVHIDQARRIIAACMTRLKPNLPRSNPVTQQRWSLTMAKNYLTALKLFIATPPSNGAGGNNRGGFFGPIIIKEWQKKLLFRLSEKKQKRRSTTQRVVTAWRYMQRAAQLMPRTSPCKPLMAKAGEALLNSLLLLNLKRLRASLDQITLVSTAVWGCMPQVLATKLGATLVKARSYIRSVFLYVAVMQKKRTRGSNKDIPKATTGNPVDDCWVGDPNWDINRQNLADCAAGYGESAGGGYGGPVYVVTTTADDPKNPVYGSLRYGVTRDGPLWITFARDMTFSLASELFVSSYKTIDARGANVTFDNSLCIVVREAYGVIIHGITFFNCSFRLGFERIRIAPTLAPWIGNSIGHAVLVQSAVNVWIDHCAFDSTVLSTAGKHIDVKIGSTFVTVSNCFFQNQNKVMLLGHNDTYQTDRGMKVSVMLNVFGRNLVQRMPRCRFGDFHVVNNYYPHGWGMYTVGGSSNPTILSHNNYYVATKRKEVTKRFSHNWQRWNWKSKGDAFIAGAFFLESGTQAPLEPDYEYAAQPASSVPRITRSAGPLLCRVGATCVPRPAP